MVCMPAEMREVKVTRGRAQVAGSPHACPCSHRRNHASMSGPLSRDLPLMAIVATLFALPLFHTPGNQLVPRELIKSITSAVAVVVGATGVVVLGGGILLVGEKAWWKLKSWRREQQRRRGGSGDDER